MAYVYRHIRLDKNEPFYVGIGTDTNGYYKRAFARDGRNKLWRDVVAKTIFETEIVFDEVSIEYAHEKEREFIKLYGKKVNGGILCNLTDGGEGWPGLEHTEETKRRISQKKKGTISPMKGKKSEVRGERHGMFGKTHSDELKKKWKMTRKGAVAWNEGLKWGRDIKVSEKMQKAQEWRRVEVFQYDLNKVFIEKFDSILDAQKATGIRRGNIWHCMQGNRKTSGGYIWMQQPLVKG